MTDFVYYPQVDVISQTAEMVELSLLIPKNLYYFQGHFTQAPILAGVAQLDWVMTYLAKYFDVDKTKLSSVDALKFQIIVRPNYRINLMLNRVKPNKFSFNYSSEHGQHASGKVVFS
ncbi:MAG: acyl-CoA synthetase [Gammaproteobacteria bacterium]|nr:acyl-CoA synthetase [Gammaproteobacteria bacterium]